MGEPLMRLRTTNAAKSGPAAALAGLVALLAAGLATLPARAAEDALAPEHHHWHFDGPFGVYDKAALQRGYQVYREVCANCHAMEFLNFRHLGDAGGPFYDPEFPNPNDNPVIKALAAEFKVEEIDPETGDLKERNARPSDAFPKPYPNEAAARAGNGGALPPDLSVMIKARAHGPDYVRALLIGYGRTPPPDVKVEPPLYYNPWFAGEKIAMKAPLTPDQVTYSDATPASVEQMAEDVVEFLAWASDPHANERKRLGFITIAFLSLLAVLFWLSYRQVWRGVKH